MKVGLLILLYLTFVFWVLDADINLERMLVLNLLSMIYVLSLYPFMYLGVDFKKKDNRMVYFLIHIISLPSCGRAALMDSKSNR